MSESDTNPSDNPRSMNQKLDAAGKPTITDKRAATAPTQEDVAAYQCPFCGFTAPSERTVRAHITEETDGNHKNRNGYLDQIFVSALDEDGERIDTVQTEFTEQERRNGAVTTEMFPDGVTEKQRRILEVAIQNPGLSNRAVVERCEERFDYSPSDGYVSRVRNDHLRSPDQESKRKARAKDYDDLTDIQQAIVDEVIKFPNPTDIEEWPITQTEVAERAGTVQTNIRPTVKKYANLIRHRKARLDARQEAGIAQADDESEAEPQAESEAEAEAEGITVSRETLRTFARELNTLKESATAQADSAPRDSPMKLHATGKLEVIDRAESLLQTIAQESDYQPGGESDE